LKKIKEKFLEKD